jgi:hypothetical protein
VWTVVSILAGSRAAWAAPSISYPTFLFNAPFSDNGNAAGVNFNSLLLTYDGNQNSSNFVIASQDLTQSFTAQFAFTMGAGDYHSYSDGTGPGGIAFVIQNDSRGTAALGGGNDQVGYGDGLALAGKAVQNSLAVVYSTFGGGDQFQIMTNTTNANLDTTSAALATQTGSENLDNNALQNQVTVNYEQPSGTYPNGALTVLLNNASIGLDNVALPASLISLAGSSTGYFGFTASTGGTTGTGPVIAVDSLIAGAPVPEPASALILAAGSLALLARRPAQSGRS